LPTLTCRTGGLGVGVADGVYMWKQQGIDSGMFSRSLMRYAKQAIKDGEANPVKGGDQTYAHMLCPIGALLGDKAVDGIFRGQSSALCWRQSCCAILTPCGKGAQKLNAQQVACQ
jgi:hypothetical protein